MQAKCTCRAARRWVASNERRGMGGGCSLGQAHAAKPGPVGRREQGNRAPLVDLNHIHTMPQGGCHLPGQHRHQTRTH